MSMQLLDVQQQDMNLYPVMISLGLFVVMLSFMASFLGFILA